MSPNEDPSQYKLCDAEGKELEEDNGAYILNLNGQEIRLR